MNMKLFAILLAFLLLFICNLSRACEQNVQFIKSGTPAPCSAFLVKESKMQELAKRDDELILQKKLNQQLEQLRTLDKAEIDFYRVQSQSRAKELTKEENKRFWSNLGHFTLGVVLTGLAAKAAIEASR